MELISILLLGFFLGHGFAIAFDLTHFVDFISPASLPIFAASTSYIAYLNYKREKYKQLDEIRQEEFESILHVGLKLSERPQRIEIKDPKTNLPLFYTTIIVPSTTNLAPLTKFNPFEASGRAAKYLRDRNFTREDILFLETLLRIERTRPKP